MFRSALQERDAVPGRAYTFRLKLYNELRLLQAASLILLLSACGNSQNTAGETETAADSSASEENTQTDMELMTVFICISRFLLQTTL